MAWIGRCQDDGFPVAGFDGIDLSRVAQPALTTVRQPMREMGRMEVSVLDRMLAGREIHTLHVEPATELVVRGSTGRAPASVD
jgi:LacI family transcriptional regulator